MTGVRRSERVADPSLVRSNGPIGRGWIELPEPALTSPASDRLKSVRKSEWGDRRLEPMVELFLSLCSGLVLLLTCTNLFLAEHVLRSEIEEMMGRDDVAVGSLPSSVPSSIRTGRTGAPGALVGDAYEELSARWRLKT